MDRRPVAIRVPAPEELREIFERLAEEWENDTIFLSFSGQAAEHPAHREIVNLGKSAVPLVLERMRSHGGHWFHTLREITNADPVPPADRGRVEAMKASWLEWGERNGYV